MRTARGPMKVEVPRSLRYEKPPRTIAGHRVCIIPGCDTVLSKYNVDTSCNVHGGSHGDFARLSPREKAILTQMLLGLDNIQIADKFGISYYTFKTNLSSIYRKLGVGNRKDAVNYVSVRPELLES